MAGTRPTARRHRLLQHPGQAVVLGFAVAVAIGTVLLMLPAARSGQGGASLEVALFTSTSAVCVTGLAVVDTPSYWSTFGEVVIAGLVQIGGLGIMTLASLLGLLVSRRLGLRTRLTAAAETNTIGLGDVRAILVGVLTITAVFEVLVAAILTLRFATRYDEPWGTAIYHGVFHSITAFNNAGFALWSDSLIGFVGDPWICLPIAVSVIAGGLGFPVWLELIRGHRHPRRWSLHTSITLWASGLLLVLGMAMVFAGEWRNPRTLGELDLPTRLLAGLFQSVMPRSAGFNSLDYGAMNDETLLGTSVLMLIGGGSASTAGGIKVTTFMLLFFAILAEVRGERDVTVHETRIDPRVIRQALTVALLGVAAVMGTTLVLLQHHGLRQRRGALRGGLRVQHDRSVHRHHRRSPDLGTTAAGRRHVPGSARADHAGLGARAAIPRTALPLSGRTADHWLGTIQAASR